MARRTKADIGEQPVSNRDEFHLIRQTMGSPGWKLLTLRWHSLQDGCIAELQDDLRMGRPIHAMMRQLVLDMVTKMLEMPQAHQQSLEAILDHEINQREQAMPKDLLRR